ncbi:hypothetical protein ES703_121720 [subsurface metagenome]
MKMKTKHLVIIAITAIVIVGLVRGLDPDTYLIALGILAGLGGYKAYQLKHEK